MRLRWCVGACRVSSSGYTSVRILGKGVGGTVRTSNGSCSIPGLCRLPQHTASHRSSSTCTAWLHGPNSTPSLASLPRDIAWCCQGTRCSCAARGVRSIPTALCWGTSPREGQHRHGRDSVAFSCIDARWSVCIRIGDRYKRAQCSPGPWRRPGRRHLSRRGGRL